MEWLAIIGLAAWTLILHRRVGALSDKLNARAARPLFDTAPSDIPTITQPAPGSFDKGGPEVEPEYFKPVAAVVVAEEPPRQPRAAPERTTQNAAPKARASAFQWLSENALAWIGGLAMALGGALLVGYAAERGLFTPTLRLIAAMTAGAAMIVGGEWIRRRPAEGSRHRLAAALSAGAGAATLYASAWAAYYLYRFIPAPAAEIALAAISLGLFGLALIHGEPLALLAVVGGFAAPLILGRSTLGGAAIDGYLLVMTTTGLVVATWRRWTLAALASLAAIGSWAILRDVGHDVAGGAFLLVSAPAILLAVRALMPPKPTEAGAALEGFLSLIAVLGAAIVGLVFVMKPDEPVVAIFLATLTVVIAASIAGARVPSRALAAPAILTVLAILVLFRGAGPPAGATAWLLLPIAILGAASLILVAASAPFWEASVIGAASVALGLTLLARDPMATPFIFLFGAIPLAAGAVLIAVRSTDPARDWALAAWIGAASEVGPLFVHASVPEWARPLGCGVEAAIVAGLASRLPWRGLAQSAAFCALVSLAGLFAPALASAAFIGNVSWTVLAGVGGGATLLQAVATWFLRGRYNALASREATLTAAIVSGLSTGFLLLQLWASTPGTGLNSFTQTALQTVLLTVVGTVVTIRGGETTFARVRGPVFLAIGLVDGLLANAGLHAFSFAQNPVLGPPLLDTLALAYLAPALLFAVTGWRVGPTEVGPFRLSAAGALSLGTVWMVSEIHRLFHGVHMSPGATYAEGTAYGLAALVVCGGLTLRLGRPATGDSSAPNPSPMLNLALLAIFTIGLYFLCVASSPWWGPLRGDLTTPALLFGLQAVALVGSFILRRRSGLPSATIGALLGGLVIQAFSLMTLMIRYAFHGPAMRAPLAEASVETWTYSAAWAAYGLAVLVVGARSRDRTAQWFGLGLLLLATLKVFFYDMATLQGPARAASFLALGALLIVAALVARRTGATDALLGRTAPAQR